MRGIQSFVLVTAVIASFLLVSPGSNLAWTAISTTTGGPTARSLHTAVWTGSDMLVWGGLDSGGLSDSGGPLRSGGQCLDDDLHGGRSGPTLRSRRGVDRGPHAGLGRAG